MLSPCSFHSSWSCAALHQGHPASRDQLTDQEQCEAAKRITTRAKILSIDGPKPSAKNAVDSRVAKVGFFSHEYGRRVGMVPRSSLKEGKNNQMVVKGTKTPNQPKPNTKARRPQLHHLVVFPLHWVKRVKRRLVAIIGPEFSREKGRQRKLCSWKAA